MSVRACAVLLALLPYMIGCDAGAEGPLTADGTVLHLDEHLADAIVVGSEIPTDLLQSVDWDDEDLLAEWGPYEGDGRANWLAGEPAIVGPGDGAMRISADKRHRAQREWLSTVATTLVDEWLAGDWSHVLVRARTSDPLNMIGFIVGRGTAIQIAEGAPAITDGQVHTYRFDLPPRLNRMGPLEWIGVGFVADVPGSLDVLSVSAVPRRMTYAEIGGAGRAGHRAR